MSRLEKLVAPTRETVRAKVIKEHELASREQAVRFTRGNVAIQQNAFFTKKEVEEDLKAFFVKK